MAATGCSSDEDPPAGAPAPTTDEEASSGGEQPSDPAPSSSAPPVDGARAQVVRITDGDTLVVRLDGSGEATVRLIGVNAPEDGECFSDEAAAALTDLLADREVTLLGDESDLDQYDRLLRYVEVGGLDVNEELARLGVARSRAYPPDTARQASFDAAEADARAAGRGLWAADACGPATSVEGDVVIVAVLADPPGSDEADPNAETATLANGGGGPVDLSGWVLKDTSSSHRFTFPEGFVLAAGAQVVVHTGCGADTATDLHWCNQGSLVWNNDGDTAYLEDPAGNTVSTFEVEP